MTATEQEEYTPPVLSSPLLPQEVKILAYIQEFKRGKRYSPAIREIARATGFASTHPASWCLKRLQDRGLLTFDERTSRSIVLRGERLAFYCDFDRLVVREGERERK